MLDSDHEEETMTKEIDRQIELLCSKNNDEAYQALKTLEEASEQTKRVYPYMNRFVEMMDHANSYVRSRGLRPTPNGTSISRSMRFSTTI